MDNYSRYFRITVQPEHFTTVEELLFHEGFIFDSVAFFAPARKLTSGPKVLGESMAARLGLIYIQDRSSMLPPLCLVPAANSIILDMCASPGSKTSQLAWIMNGHGLIVANEANQKRLATLQANLFSLNCQNVVTTNYPAESFPVANELFDSILLDPPCSGWGTILKNSDVDKIWTASRTKPLVLLQQTLLTKAAQILRPGGSIVYSTCTTNTQENQEQVYRILEQSNLVLLPLPLPDQVLAQPNAVLRDSMLSVQVDKEYGQGFFIAKLGKPGPAQCSRPQTTNDYELREIDGRIYTKPDMLADLPATLQFSGLPVGKVSATGRYVFYAKFRKPYAEPELALHDTHGPDELHGLLNGQSLKLTDFENASGQIQQSGQAIVTWRNLPLGRVTLKQNRIIWAR